MISQNRGLNEMKALTNRLFLMFCAIYKSPKKENTYLYINTKDDFSDVPESLMTTFGTPQFVMVLKLDNGRKLALADVEKVKEALATVGYYLQVPPPVTNLLEKYKADKVGKDAKG